MIEGDAKLDGRRVHYRSAGSGPPVMLLHAVGESSFSWTRVMPALATAHTVIAPDLPGFGGSDPPAGPFTPQRYADVVARCLDRLGAGPATVVGSSFGGAVALHLTLRHPDRVARLVLVDSTALGRYIHPALAALTLPGYGDATIAVARTSVGSAGRAWLRVPLLFHNPALAPPDWLAEQRRLAHLPDHLRTTLATLRAQVSPLGQRHVLLSALPRITVPTLLVWGADDAVMPVRHARAALARLPHGHLEILPRCGHLPQLERPELLVSAFDRFCTRS